MHQEFGKHQPYPNVIKVPPAMMGKKKTNWVKENEALNYESIENVEVGETRW